MSFIEKLQQKLNSGNTEAAFNLGVVYFKGLHGEKVDYAKAFRYFSLAADDNFAKAQNNLAYLYEFGLGTKKDLKQAEYYYSKSSENGNLVAKCNLLHLYETKAVKTSAKFDFIKEYKLLAGQGLLRGKYKAGKLLAEEDDQECEKYLKSCSSKGHILAKIALLKYYDESFFANINHKEEHTIAQELANANYPRAYYILGYNYYMGNYVKEDKDQALKYYIKGAELGDKSCTYWAGKILEDDKNDPSTAFKYFKMGADFGDGYCAGRLGRFYERGLVVEKDYSLAFKYYSYAASLDDNLGQLGLGICYLRGHATDIDYEKAYEYFCDAEETMTLADFYLGWLFHHGYYVKQDIYKAYLYYKTAFEEGEQSFPNLGVYFDFCIENYHYDYCAEFLGILFEKAVQLEYPEVETFKAICYLKGIYFEKNIQMGKAYLKANADRGLYYACLYISRYMLKGEYYVLDEDNGAKYIKQATAKDYWGVAMYEYANCLYNGIGIKQDVANASIYYLASAKLSYLPAFTTIGKMFYIGDGGIVSYYEGFKWYLCACKAKDPHALYSMGTSLIEGQLLPQDKILGIELLIKACEKGLARAANKLLEYHDSQQINLNFSQLFIVKKLAD